MKIKSHFFWVFFLAVCSLSQNLFSIFSGNREYPFYSTVKLSSIDGPTLRASAFFTNTMPVIENYHGDRVKNPWERYDLRDLNKSIQEHAKLSGQPVEDFLSAPSIAKILGPDYDLTIDMELQRNTQGMSFNFSYTLADLLNDIDDSSDFGRRHSDNLKSVDVFAQAGFSLMSANSVGIYRISADLENRLINQVTGGSTIPGFDPEKAMTDLEAARQRMHEKLGFSTVLANQQGVSDLNLTLGLRKRLDYALRCRHIDLTCAIFGTVPSGSKKDENNSLTFDFGREGKTLGAMLALDSELKYNLFAGMMFSFDLGFKSTKKRRVSIGKEPNELSPLVAENITIDSGSTFVFSPYFDWKNFKDGINFGMRFAYINHGEDAWSDNRQDPVVGSFLRGSNLDTDPIEHRRSTAWTAKFVNFNFSYNPGQRFEFWNTTPEFFVSYDYPWTTDTTIRNRRLSIGAKISF